MDLKEYNRTQVETLVAAHCKNMSTGDARDQKECQRMILVFEHEDELNILRSMM